MKLVKLLLYPLAGLYNLGARIRNYLFDIGHKSSFQFDRTLISVGNLNVGGSGKTPMVEYLVQLLKGKCKVATLSRGYKRDTSGYRAAGEADTAATLGDEPLQLYRKFGKEINVVVGEDRAYAIPHILHEFPDTQVIVLDDAFQHRSVKPKLSILVTEYSKPFYKDFVLPFGRLREARKGAVRSDLVVVTKCHGSLSSEDEREITLAIQEYAGAKPVFFSSIYYDVPVPIGKPSSLSGNVILVTGIAQPAHLKMYCQENFNLIRHFDFEDHHRYTASDLNEIEYFCNKQSLPYSIITTEKDMVKLVAPPLKQHLARLPWFYLPVRQVFLQNGLKFDEIILAAIDGATVTK